MVIRTDYIGSCKCNYHKITTTTTPMGKQVTLLWYDDDHVCFLSNQHTKLDFHRSSSMWVQSVCWYVALLMCFALSTYFYEHDREATHKSFTHHSILLSMFMFSFTFVLMSFLNGTAFVQDFVIVYWDLYCRWNNSYEEGVGIPLLGRIFKHRCLRKVWRWKW